MRVISLFLSAMFCVCILHQLMSKNSLPSANFAPSCDPGCDDPEPPSVPQKPPPTNTKEIRHPLRSIDPTMIRKCKAFHNLGSLTTTGTAAQALELKIKGEKPRRRNSNESCASSSTALSVSSSDDINRTFDLNEMLLALDDGGVEDFPTIAWDFED